MFFSIFDSALFEFVIGPNKRSFILHAAAISRLSDPLNAMMNGNLFESVEKRVELDDIDEEIWKRFCQFAYCGDYTPVGPGVFELPEQDTLLFNPESYESDLGVTLGKSWKKQSRIGFGEKWDNSSKRIELWKAFRSIEFPSSKAQDLPPKNENHQESWQPVFLCHARLYVFADKWCIESLRIRCLHKLKGTLERFNVFPRGCDDICDLINYSYQNTQSSRIPDPLRSLLVDYTACIVEYLSAYEVFRSLLQTQSTFSRDLVLKMLARLD